MHNFVKLKHAQVNFFIKTNFKMKWRILPTVKSNFEWFTRMSIKLTFSILILTLYLKLRYYLLSKSVEKLPYVLTKEGLFPIQNTRRKVLNRIIKNIWTVLISQSKFSIAICDKTSIRFPLVLTNMLSFRICTYINTLF